MGGIVTISKQTKTQKNQIQLLEAFQKKQTLSIREIETLLNCNRQSVYNYIKRLEQTGYTFIKFTQKNHTYYSFQQDNSIPEEILYEPMTFDILRKYTIIQQLQQGAVPKNKLKNKFAFYHKTTQLQKTANLSPSLTDECAEGTKKEATEENLVEERDCTPLDVGVTYYYRLLHDLIAAGEIEFNHATKKYFLTGKNIPLEMVLDKDTLDKLHIILKTITNGTPYYNQFKSIYNKTSLLLGDVTDVTPYFENYIVYGKKMDGLTNIAEQLKNITTHDYQNKVLQIRYQTKKQGERSVLFAVGMLLYSVEKDILYLIGEEYSQKNEAQTYPYSIINVSTISQIDETIVTHSCYHSAYYTELFHSMFSISIETPVHVKVEFNRILNIERKIRLLTKQRKYAHCEILENKIIYTDKISGLSDFAMYLRKLGRSAHVIEPPVLRERMKDSVERTLQRYKEELSDELS